MQITKVRKLEDQDKFTIALDTVWVLPEEGRIRNGYVYHIFDADTGAPALDAQGEAIKTPDLLTPRDAFRAALHIIQRLVNRSQFTTSMELRNEDTDSPKWMTYIYDSTESYGGVIYTEDGWPIQTIFCDTQAEAEAAAEELINSIIDGEFDLADETDPDYRLQDFLADDGLPPEVSARLRKGEKSANTLAECNEANNQIWKRHTATNEKLAAALETIEQQQIQISSLRSTLEYSRREVDDAEGRILELDKANSEWIDRFYGALADHGQSAANFERQIKMAQESYERLKERLRLEADRNAELTKAIEGAKATLAALQEASIQEAIE